MARFRAGSKERQDLMGKEFLRTARSHGARDIVAIPSFKTDTFRATLFLDRGPRVR